MLLLLHNCIPEEIWADVIVRGLLDPRDVMTIIDATDHAHMALRRVYNPCRPLTAAEREWFAARDISVLEPMQRHILPSVTDTLKDTDPISAAYGFVRFPPIPTELSPYATELNALGLNVDHLPICLWTLAGKLHSPPDGRPAVECTHNVGSCGYWSIRVNSPAYAAWCADGERYGEWARSQLAELGYVHHERWRWDPDTGGHVSNEPISGVRFWFRHGKVHRDDEPAILWPMQREWYQDGVLRACQKMGKPIIIP